jgi:hypothetical protein
MSEESIFTNALARTDPAQRRAYLDEACGADGVLRREVEALLATHEADSGFLERSAPEQLAGSAAPPETQAESPQSVDDELAFLAPPHEAGHLGRLGHYEVHAVIGKGGFGIVLKAFDERLHRIVAIKVLSPAYAASAAARKRFIREARAAAAVKNEHVVGIYEVQEESQPPYLVMECVDGISLADKIERDGPLGVTEILRIGVQIAEGLAAAHKQGKVHRDIKPANILLENGVERVKITDFGLARAVDDANVTQSGTIAGTPMYMSPEQAEGLPIDHRSDLFSFGTVLYAMCTGQPPFRATGTMAVLKRVVEETPRPIRQINAEIPDWLCAIVTKLHAKKPEERFQSAKEVAELLGQHLAHLQQPSPVAEPLPPTPPASVADQAAAVWTTQLRVAAATFAVLGVIITAAGLMLFSLPAERISPPGVQWLIAGLGLASMVGAVYLTFHSTRWQLGAAGRGELKHVRVSPVVASVMREYGDRSATIPARVWWGAGLTVFGIELAVLGSALQADLSDLRTILLMGHALFACIMLAFCGLWALRRNASPRGALRMAQAAIFCAALSTACVVALVGISLTIRGEGGVIFTTDDPGVLRRRTE